MKRRIIIEITEAPPDTLVSTAVGDVLEHVIITVDDRRIGTIARDERGHHFTPAPDQDDQILHMSYSLGEMLGIVLGRVYPELDEGPAAPDISFDRREQRIHDKFVPKAINAVEKVIRENFENVSVDNEEIFFDWTCEGAAVEFKAYVSGWNMSMGPVKDPT